MKGTIKAKGFAPQGKRVSKLKFTIILSCHQLHSWKNLPSCKLGEEMLHYVLYDRMICLSEF